MKKVLIRLLSICSLLGLFGCTIDLSDPSVLLNSKITEAEIVVNSGEQEGYAYTIPKSEIDEFVNVLLEETRTFELLKETPAVSGSLFRITFNDASKKKVGELQVISASLIRLDNKYYTVDPAFDEELLETCLDATTTK